MVRRWSKIGILLALLIIAQASARTPAPVDFRAFYCAGAATAVGADPYRLEPLRTCEKALTDPSEAHPRGSAVPAPLPGYDLAFFALLSRIPYPQAEMLWQALLWSCVFLAALAVRACTHSSFTVIATALFFTGGYIASLNGQLAPVALAGIALSGYFLSRRRHALAAISLTAAMCEPHVTSAAVLALLIFAPAARAATVLGLCLLGALTFMTTGIVQTREYFHDVLPLHISSEIPHVGQYSLTHLLHVFGASDTWAVIGGTGSYALMLIAGVIVAGRLRDALREDIVLTTVPVAFALIGGSFVHIWQIAAALPAAFILHDRLPHCRKPLVAAILLLSMPWSDFAVMQNAQPYAALCLAYLVRRLTGSAPLAFTAAGLQLAMLSVATIASHRQGVALPSIVVDPRSLSEEAWKPVVLGAFGEPVLLTTLFSIPTWCGLLLISYVCLKNLNTPVEHPR